MTDFNSTFVILSNVPNIDNKHLDLGGEVISGGIQKNSGPIFLDELLCTEDDNVLHKCDYGIQAFGLTTCDHTHDAWIRCKGTSGNHSVLCHLQFYVLKCI